jgi:hypothetical protein
MLRMILGALIGAALVVAAMCLIDQRSLALAQRNTWQGPPAGSSDLLALPMQVGDKGQLLTVLDTRQHTVAVYWIEATSGKIALRSVRNIQWDLQLTDFNSENPLPREIRLQLEHSLR